MKDQSPTLASCLRSMFVHRHFQGLRDSELLRCFIEAQDRDGFATLMRRHGPMVLGLARRVVRDHQLAEDVFQATFYMLARKARAISRHESLPAWLHSVAFRLALRAGKTRRRALEAEALAPTASCTDPLDDVSAREDLTILHEELQRLPEKYRLPLILCHLEGLSQEEAAKRLDVSPGSLKGNLERGRAQLRSMLARRGLDADAGPGRLAPSLPLVSPALVQETVRLAMTGQGGSLGAHLLASAATKLMFLAQLKLVCAGVLFMGVVGLGASWIAIEASSAKERMPGALILSAVANDKLSQQPRDDATSKQVHYAVNNRSARELAMLLEKQFGGVDGVQIVPDGSKNALLLTARPGDLDELLNTLAKLDRRPQEVAIQILILRMPARMEAGGQVQPGDFDVQQLSGSTESVLAKIDVWQKKGVFTAVDRFQLKATENQTAKLNNLTNTPFTTGGQMVIGLAAAPKFTPRVAYKTLGTTFTVTAQIGPAGFISLDLRAVDETAKQLDGMRLFTQNGQGVSATEFITGTLESKITLRSGQAVLVKDAQLKSNNAGERILMVVTALSAR